MSEMERFKQTFFQECTELLSELEERFGEITQGQGGMEAAQAVFRAVHSIKGGAGAFGFADLVGFAHVLEALLDDIRNGKKHFTPEIILICLRSCDGLADLLANARDGIKGMSPAVAQAKAALEDLQGSKASAGAPDSFEDLEFQPVQMAINAPADDAAPGQWIITFRPLPALYQRANEPLFIFQELANLGPLEVECHVLDAPPLAQFDPLDVLLHWTLRLETSAARSQIEAAFDFCDGDCQLEITEPAPAPASEELSLEALLAQTQVKPAVLPAPPLPVPAEGATDIAGASRAAPNLAAQTIRVDLDRVDRVADMTGELVIAQAMITGQIDARLRMDYPDLVRGLETLAQHTRMLQDSIMAIRAQPVKAVFARVPRLLRELASVTGKKVRLETEGENTEIDRTVIEQLNDPLTHMIRNAMDHGIETPEQRRAAGKREEGLIRLSAEQASGRIIIRITDDGAGINRERVVRKAVEKGLIAKDANLTDDEIDQLIFMAGFSTAEAVSDLSGRGVGMDVVRENIQRMGGRVNVRSVAGKGCTITLSLPLTLAILDVMIVEVGGEPYVLPLANVVESLRYQDAQISRLPSGEVLVKFRKYYAKVFDLSALFEVASLEQDARFLVMCDTEADYRIGLVVDAVLGQQQVAIKSLEANFGRVEGFSGATIMGDGRVALIMDVPGLERWHLAKFKAGALAA